HAWVARITRNTALDLGRKLRVRATDPLPGEASLPADRSLPPDQVAEQLEASERLMSLLGQLPEVERAPLVLHYIEGKTHEEAARLLGLTPAAFNSRLNRARDK